MDKNAVELFESLGVRPIVNAAGPISQYGGGRSRPEVIEAVATAFRVPVQIHELNRRAGETIAEMIGVEAAFVSSGAAGGLVLQAAACIAGTDEDKMKRLPDSTGMNNEIIIQTCQRFGYDQSYLVGGGRIVNAGESEGCSPEQLEEAFTDRTAAAAYLFAAHASRNAVPFDRFCEIAHSRGVPVVVDAANFLPPRSNMRRFMDEGADMVAFSGGKAVRGPQGAGILLGRTEFIEAARANGSPNNFVARSMKVSKEEIVGLITAIKVFLNEDEEAETARYTEMCRQAVDALVEIPGVTVSLEHDGRDYLIPTAVVRFNEDWRGPTQAEILSALSRGDPPVFVRTLGGPGEIGIDPINLDEETLDIVIRRVREALLSK
ncbi:MAG: aminotransferase class V-fold PLP-dependent enzyme [Chloroflexi bacterium]|nr:aminotransferase class V-fold PLP-dependent enzyme [Chloroflexota bacterium]